MPPPDELLISSGLKASSFLLEETDETIIIQPPYKIDPKIAVQTNGWPSTKSPLWAVWKYALRPKDEEEYSKLANDDYDSFVAWQKSK